MKTSSLHLSDGTTAAKGVQVVKTPGHDGMIGTIVEIYPKGTDKHKMPHSYDDALVRWPNGVTNYEYLHGLRAQSVAA